MQEEGLVARRGQEISELCRGRLLYTVNKEGRPVICCEHYNSHTSRYHLLDYTPSREQLELNYLEVYFSNDVEELLVMEKVASHLGFGPHAPCMTVENYSAQRTHCSIEHRNEDDQLTSIPLIQMHCKSRFLLYSPLEEERENCSLVLLVCIGPHTHPIPFPRKTPKNIQAEVFDMLCCMDLDLADATPRCMMRHPAVIAHLRSLLSNGSDQDNTLSDLHPSLANKDHLRIYVDKIKGEEFPLGTDWKGLINLKEIQDKTHPKEEHYLRFIGTFTHNGEVYTGQDLSDCVCYSRIFLNCQSTQAHLLVFQKINEIVREDTGNGLRWRHLHSTSLEEPVGIYSFAVDHHLGQVIGLGRYLQSVTKSRQLNQNQDLHEPHCALGQLSDVEHLRRVLHLCNIHWNRKISQGSFPVPVKKKMYSLACTTHPNWEETLRLIANEGGKTAIDWINYKVNCKFSWAAICWEFSYIPLVIWKAGDRHTNTIETLNSDRLKSAKLNESLGIHQGYHTGAESERINKNLKCSQASHLKAEIKEDTRISKVNGVVQKTAEHFQQVKHPNIPALEAALDQAQRADDNALNTAGKLGSGPVY
ncbi:hypothetical protein M422DRAFT_46016 [Sphaerobolus stellatus SS14]|uniref:Uncharacterized protein n=1 Tax=Sphaerobolus stellatus (strain SS14) TaxID=990650 RepID=A0A0C9W566_SPHS4|nr:hypothetical protein M422DRAFT_46016 [Sphaerobolus stellatus SS14]